MTRWIGALLALLVGAHAEDIDSRSCDHGGPPELSGCCEEWPQPDGPGGDAAEPVGAVLLQSTSAVGMMVRSWGQATVLADEELEPPSEPQEGTSPGSKLGCRTRVHASEIDPGTSCPASCPFWAEEVGGHRCQFRCVTSAECGKINPNDTVADHDGMYCRACIVPGCEQCNTDGGGDLCMRCRAGYTFYQGQCLSHFRWVWYVLYSVVFVLLAYLLWWYLDLRSMEITNKAGLEQGLRFRSRTRLHKPREGSEARKLWPLETNLLTEQVAGPGLALFFNFQLAVLIWALTMLLGWLLLSLVVSTDLLILGTKRAATPQQLCTVTTWGFKTQHSLMWAKVLFMCLAYAASFLGALLHAVCQLRRFHGMDDEATMKDYAALASGLPEWRGDEKEAEKRLRRSLEKAADEEIVGVSICWNFADKAEEVLNVISADTERTQRVRPSFSKHRLPFEESGSARSSNTSIASGSEHKSGGMLSPALAPARFTFDVLNASLGFCPPLEECAEASPAAAPQMVGQDLLQLRMRQRPCIPEQAVVLGGLTSTHMAFVVFPSEEARDKAVAVSRRSGGFDLRDDNDDSESECRPCKLQAVTFEPETVYWAHFAVTTRESVIRLVIGIFCIALALALWTLCCYLPYALYVTSFSYARGERPTTVATLTFTMLVVAGNQTMYFVCRAVSEWARFRCKDTAEMTYIVLYFLACLVNFGMDLAVTSYTTYHMMVGMNARTSSGVPLEELSVLQIFESYPMQRALGHFFFWYAFPSCFLVPFLVEPLFAIWLPGHIRELLVRSHSSVRGMDAEKHLGYFSPMDLGRYSDCLLNMTIAVVAFLFPGSYIWKMFLALFCSHVYIICMDHYRVLRAVPACNFSTNASELCAEALTAIPLGLLAACVVLKHRAMKGTERLSDGHILWTMLTAMVGHVLLHWFILLWLLPTCGRRHDNTPVTYAEVSKRKPCSWFSANPVHCLRSRYIHEDKPPCDFYILGKEHLLRANPRIGVYFQDEQAAPVSLQRVGTF